MLRAEYQVYLVSHATASRTLHAYQPQHHVILQCPGTMLDMGRILTHKDLIVRLHLLHCIGGATHVHECSSGLLHAPPSRDVG